MTGPYARAGVGQALSSGLGNIIQMLMAKREDEEARELEELRRQKEMRMQGAAELSQPGVIPFEQGVRDYNITDESLSAIGNAAVSNAPVRFTPRTRTVEVPGKEPIEVQETPTMTPFGNVFDSGIVRALGRAEEQEGYNLGLERAQTERDRIADLMSDYFDPRQEAGYRAFGEVLPPVNTLPVLTPSESRQRKKQNMDRAATWAAGVLTGEIELPGQGTTLAEEPNDESIAAALQGQFGLTRTEAEVALQNARVANERRKKAGGSNWLTHVMDDLDLGGAVDDVTSPADATAQPAPELEPGPSGDIDLGESVDVEDGGNAKERLIQKARQHAAATNQSEERLAQIIAIYEAMSDEEAAAELALRGRW